MSNLSVIIVAAGKGLRMGAELPKQFLSISERPMLMDTISQFSETLPEAEIILALNEEYIPFWNELCVKYSFDTPLKIIKGGNSRFQSVRNCVMSVSDIAQFVLIHDGVRPFVSSELINRVVSSVELFDAVIPVISIVDSLREVISDSTSKVVDRENYKIVQTPQAFSFELLKKAYAQSENSSFTDDASVVEKFGFIVNMVEGDRRNIKITTVEDMKYAIFCKKR